MNKKQFITTSFNFHLFGVIKNTVCEMTSIHQYTLETSPSVRGFRYCRFDDFKPILHPLSDLTKPIEHKGEKFVSMETLFSLWSRNKKPEYLEYYHNVSPNYNECSHCGTAEVLKVSKCEIMKNPAWIVFKLIEWHFDIADLISKGEAIDVNTLSENPYK